MQTKLAAARVPARIGVRTSQTILLDLQEFARKRDLTVSRVAHRILEQWSLNQRQLELDDANNPGQEAHEARDG